jgi:hypothetical protein
VFPFGATLNVQKPAIPILSSGTVSYPLNRPIGAVYYNPVRLIRNLLLLSQFPFNITVIAFSLGKERSL